MPQTIKIDRGNPDGLVINSIPSPALSGSGSEGVISALLFRHPYWFDAKVSEKLEKR